ncbi:hypothetical protein [Microcoleus sp. K5-D4]|uniref:hypothetical protein n=1 Tax=Microcoleus sp. K5-D4 TaxID=2818801 RepID=UPI002FD5A235
METLKKSQLRDWEDIKHELEWLENPNYSVSADVSACWDETGTDSVVWGLLC